MGCETVIVTEVLLSQADNAVNERAMLIHPKPRIAPETATSLIKIFLSLSGIPQYKDATTLSEGEESRQTRHTPLPTT